MGEFREFNYADEQFSDKLFAHFDPHFLPILTLFSQRKKKSNFADFGPISAKISFLKVYAL